MTHEMPDDLWRDFRKTATEFETRCQTKEDCRACWIMARWSSEPAGALCQSERVWTIRGGTTFECAECGQQTSLTSRTLLEKIRKPLKTWFRAIFEILTPRTGISAMDLMRFTGFGSYKTAWIWQHELRGAMVRSDSEPMGPFVQIDETLVGGTGGPYKELVLVAAEANGRVRLARADNNDTDTCARFACEEIDNQAHVVTDGHAGYNERSPEQRTHEPVVQTKAERREQDAVVQACHWMISLLKRWLLGKHAGAVSDKHLQACLDEFAFRHNRRKTNGVGRIAACVIENLIAKPPRTMREIIDQTSRCRWFASTQPEPMA